MFKNRSSKPIMMSIWNLFRKKNKTVNGLRVITTLRGKRQINFALKKGEQIIYRNVEPFCEKRGKYRILINKRTALITIITDIRNAKDRNPNYYPLTSWRQLKRNRSWAKKAAYLIPKDIREGEVVYISDLIENYNSSIGPQGNYRLNSCEAIWQDNDLTICFDPKKDTMRVFG